MIPKKNQNNNAPKDLNGRGIEMNGWTSGILNVFLLSQNYELNEFQYARARL